jgi:hypothetical protein
LGAPTRYLKEFVWITRYVAQIAKALGSRESCQGAEEAELHGRNYLMLMVRENRKARSVPYRRHRAGILRPSWSSDSRQNFWTNGGVNNFSDFLGFRQSCQRTRDSGSWPVVGSRGGLNAATGSDPPNVSVREATARGQYWKSKRIDFRTRRNEVRQPRSQIISKSNPTEGRRALESGTRLG